jgi:hypothetical protein
MSSSSLIAQTLPERAQPPAKSATAATKTKRIAAEIAENTEPFT